MESVIPRKFIQKETIVSSMETIDAQITSFSKDDDRTFADAKLPVMVDEYLISIKIDDLMITFNTKDLKNLVKEK